MTLSTFQTEKKYIRGWLVAREGRNKNILDDDCNETFTSKPRTVLQHFRLSSRKRWKQRQRGDRLMGRTDRLWHNRLPMTQ